MHELSLLLSVVEVVEKAARDAGAWYITKVKLQVGALSGADTQALIGAWPFAIADHPLFFHSLPDAPAHQAQLDLDLIPATIWCPTCNRDVPIDEFFALTCPVCSTPTAHLTHGHEFSVAWVEWEKNQLAATPEESPMPGEQPAPHSLEP